MRMRWEQRLAGRCGQFRGAPKRFTGSVAFKLLMMS
jgi:hypothetical protein